MTRLWAVVLLVMMGTGCSRNPTSRDFVPAEDAARVALDASLRAWREGHTVGRVPDTHPPVEAADGLRVNGRTLVKYDILGSVPADAPRCFAVRLTLGNPAEEVVERYVVLGIDPIWVWRHEDYVMLTHWDHKMMEKEKSSKPRSRNPGSR